jgi:hypothetical protein
MVAGDTKTVAEVSDGSDNALQVLSTMAELNAAHGRLEQAAAKKFGNAQSVFAIKRGRDSHAEMLKAVDSAAEKVEGDTASIGTGMSAVWLKRVGEQWKVDRDRHVPTDRDINQLLATPKALTRGYNEVAQGLESGTYESPEAAKADLMGKTMQAILAEEKPATKPMTQPSSNSPTTAPAVPGS